MINSAPEVVIPISSLLGEGPFWHESAIYWTDILGKKIYRYFPSEKKFEEWQLNYYIGAFAPRKSGGFVLAMQNGFSLANEFSGVLTHITNPEKEKSNNRFNDGKCDHFGRFWAGSMALDASRDQGALYMLDTDLQVHKKYFPVTISNGLCWSIDNKYMYYIDTPTQQILVFDFNLATGEITNPRTLVAIDKASGAPDGMTIDSNGCLWVALWEGGAIICYDPKSNKFLDKINLPVSQVSSCTFGGERLDKLYVTTAKVDLNQENLAKEPLAGALFKIKLSVQGLPTDLFNG